MIFGSYTDLNFNQLNEEFTATDGDGLKIHQFKIQLSADFLHTRVS